jgi:hypothetical protein
MKLGEGNLLAGKNAERRIYPVKEKGLAKGSSGTGAIAFNTPNAV